ncbi:MAG: hypothetical protein IT372_16770 [Polyangiaceae bacterium]|nr:hypothetical protein [Polyangiaceae bacterium]
MSASFYPFLAAAPPSDPAGESTYYGAISASAEILSATDAGGQPVLDLWWDPSSAGVIDGSGATRDVGAVYLPCAGRMSYDAAARALTIKLTGTAQVIATDLLRAAYDDGSITFGAFTITNLSPASLEAALTAALAATSTQLYDDPVTRTGPLTVADAVSRILGGRPFDWPAAGLHLGAGDAAASASITYSGSNAAHASWSVARLACSDAGGTRRSPAALLRMLRDTDALAVVREGTSGMHPLEAFLDGVDLGADVARAYLFDGVQYRLTDPAMTGDSVAQLRNDLIELGFAEVSAGSTYDLATAIAVAQLQYYARFATDRYVATEVARTYSGEDTAGRVDGATKREIAVWLGEGYRRPDQFFTSSGAAVTVAGSSLASKTTVYVRTAADPSGTSIGRVIHDTANGTHGLSLAGAPSLADFIAANEAEVRPLLSADATAQDDRIAVLSAVSPNEGGMNAVNTWDTAFLTTGPLQYTVGTTTKPGELPAAVCALDDLDVSTALRDFLVDLGFEASPATPADQSASQWSRDVVARVSRGYLFVDSHKIRATADKDLLRYSHVVHQMTGKRFALHPDKRIEDWYTALIGVCSDRITQIGLIMLTFDTLVRDVVRTRLQLALLLDLHVNYPHGVVSSLNGALSDHNGKTGTLTWDDIRTSWSNDLEWSLLQRFFTRRMGSRMHDPGGRADRILADAFADFARSGDTIAYTPGGTPALATFSWL